MRVLQLLAYALAFVLAVSVAAVYAYVVVHVLLQMGALPPELVAGHAPALAG